MLRLTCAGEKRFLKSMQIGRHIWLIYWRLSRDGINNCKRIKRFNTMASISLTGARDMQRKLGDISAKMRENMNRIAEAQAEQIAEKAREYCPVSEDGPIHLADTIRVEKSGIAQGRDTGGRFSSGADISVTITAGGSEYPHTVAVHENPSEHDPPTWKGKNINFRVGGPKFLERAMREGVSEVKTAMRKVLS